MQIPNRILYSQTHYSKMFLLALFIAMGTTLFSCQNKDGKKQKIDKVEVVTDTVAKERIVVGETPLDPKDTAKANVPPPPPPPKVDQVKFVNSPINTKKTSTQKSVKINCEKAKGEEEDDVAFVTGAVMQTNAEFPGGIEQFYNFFAKEFKQPENISDSNLKIRIAFAVEKNGSMSFLQADPAIDKSIENEIIRVLKSCPKWQPGESNGKKIRIQYSLPITLQ
ncbi:hypothetical protein GKZ88_05075 [Flavobacterium sp. LC2016-01]|nr:hypothetical protein [Flavobacterium sp. LC2016-01]